MYLLSASSNCIKPKNAVTVETALQTLLVSLIALFGSITPIECYDLQSQYLDNPNAFISFEGHPLSVALLTIAQFRFKSLSAAVSGSVL
jgi:hypothetical protein